MSFDKARRLARERGSGIGIALGPEGGRTGAQADHPGLAGADLDHCLDEKGKPTPEAAAIVQKLNSYTEITPSGRGLRTLLWGTKPGPSCKNTQRKIEIYDHDRYFTVTGKRFGNASLVYHRQAELEALYAELWPASKKDRATAQAAASTPVEASDEDLLEKARSAKNGDKFIALFDHGDASPWNGAQSSADQALADHLAFWTGGDFERMERLFSRSALGQRDKWRERPDYRERTLNKAIAGCHEVYSPVAGPAGNGRYRALPTAEAGDERPEIVITTDEHLVVDQALEAIKGDPALFQRGTMLVMVTRSTSAGKQKGTVERPEGSLQIETMPKPALRRIMTTNARWLSERTGRNGTSTFAGAHVPGWAVDQLADLKRWPGVRHLEGIIEAPTIRPDGSLLVEPGYDDATGLLYLPSGDFPTIPEKPDDSQAIQAADDLLSVVNDFPFASDEHRNGYLAALLTPLVRFAIEGPCPLFLFDANVAASGKTKLCDIIAILATGREMPRSKYHLDDAEMDKTLLSIALAGDRLILFDNVPGGFSIGGGSLDAALTGFTKKGRILGESRMSGEVRLSTVYYASGNNLGLRGDALRRVVPIRLESAHDRPEERTDYKEKNLLDYVRRERGRLVAAALTIARAYVVAGRPDQGLKPMDYPDWCRVVRDALAWCTGGDPCKARAELVASDEEMAQRRLLVAGFEELMKHRERDHFTVAEMVKQVTDRFIPDPLLHSLFMDWGQDGKMATAKAIGKQLSKVRRRPIDGKCFDRTDTAIRQWFLRLAKHA
jgi:hypothetical protein